MRKKTHMKAILCFSIAFVFAFVSFAVTDTTYAASKIKLNKTKVTLNVNQTTTLKVKGTSKKVTWSSSNKKVAKVSKKGKVTAVKAGKAKITAKVASKKLICKVTVKAAVPPVRDDCLSVCLASEPYSLDPALCATSDEAVMIAHLFSGLVRCESQGGKAVYVPDMAEALPEPVDNGDGTFTYTYKIRKDAKWSDGQPVTANDFEFAWKRATLQVDGFWPDYTYLFEYIAGYTYEAATIEENTLAVKATDANTLVVTANGVYPYWNQLLSFPIFAPVRSDVVDYTGTWAKNPSTYVCNGMYTMDSWVHDSEIVLKKNENHPNAANVTMPGIQFCLLSDETHMLNDFNAGKLQFINQVDLNKVSADDPQLYTQGAIGTYYCTWNSNVDLSPVGGDPLTQAEADKVRNAINLMFDRAHIANDIVGDAAEPASSFVAMGVTEPDGSQFYEHAGNSPDYNGYYSTAAGDAAANRATALEILSNYYNVSNGKITNFPKITYAFNQSEYHRSIAEYLQSELASIGITMNLNEVSWNDYTSVISSGNFTILRTGWVADFNDAVNFLEMFTTKSDINYGKLGKHANAEYNVALSSLEGYDADLSGNWSETYDVLISYINAERNLQIRNQLLHMAEDLLMETGTVCPLYYYMDSYMLSNKVKGFYSTPLLGGRYFMYTTITD